ncbi:MAG: chemotaxis response regulator protein-glutamate methylesterase [Desulfobacteraceae bacterium]|nr:chemotaxis response regulator protein-glutamate methylesterase [Desulfobacteraceae bacterium]
MITKAPLRVLVVDDTVVYRKIVSDVLDDLPGVEVVGTAHNGKAAMFKIKTLKPDILTLDIEMPEMNGLQVLEQLRKTAPHVGAIMLSTLTQEGGAMTMKALDLGAFDFIPKPQSGGMDENKELVKSSLAPILRAFSRGRNSRNLYPGKLSTGVSALQTDRKRPTSPVRHRSNLSDYRNKAASEIIAIGISTGGPKALAVLLPKIPHDIGVPILIVQHMPPLFTQSLARSLDAKCGLKIIEAENDMPIQSNNVYIAPGGKQMRVEAGADGSTRVLKITNDPPENSCKPSVDYLFRSVAHHYIGRATGVIMTGMGSDGAAGLKLMKQNGAVIIAQDEASCVVFGMPKEPIESGTVDIIASLDSISDAIFKTINKR